MGLGAGFRVRVLVGCIGRGERNSRIIVEKKIEGEWATGLDPGLG